MDNVPRRSNPRLAANALSHVPNTHSDSLRLDGCRESVIVGDLDASMKTLSSELRVQAMDFCMRNPDCCRSKADLPNRVAAACD
jgi:hypothetical protein